MMICVANVTKIRIRTLQGEQMMMKMMMKMTLMTIVDDDADACEGEEDDSYGEP